MLSTLFLESMASTHAITYVNGVLVGDPLDVKMFQSTNWVLNELHERPVSEMKKEEVVIAYTYPQG